MYDVIIIIINIGTRVFVQRLFIMKLAPSDVNRCGARRRFRRRPGCPSAHTAKSPMRGGGGDVVVGGGWWCRSVGPAARPKLSCSHYQIRAPPRTRVPRAAVVTTAAAVCVRVRAESILSAIICVAPPPREKGFDCSASAATSAIARPPMLGGPVGESSKNRISKSTVVVPRRRRYVIRPGGYTRG